MIALFPAALALLFALGCGGLESGAGGVAAAVGQVALLGSALAGGSGMGDPWRLGRRWGWLPWSLVALAAASWAASPGPRAGAGALLLLPAFVLLPGAVARALAGPRLERGALALVFGGAAVALVALADPSLLAGGRAARPLGHHQLLAAWLVAFYPLPLMLLARRGAQRALGLAGAVAIGAAILASRSLLGLSAFALQALLAHRGTRRAWRLVLGVALLAAALAVPRVERVMRGEDPSAQARLDYLAAGARGVAERPWLGWGPGATPWTVARLLAPGPGRRPAGEQVGDLHSLPAARAYELGLPGALLAAGAVAAFAAARLRERRRARDRRLLDGALLGLAGLGLVLLGNASLAIVALPVAAAVLAGLALAAGGEDGAQVPANRASRWGSRLAIAYAVIAAALLVPLARAHLAYDRARESPDPELARREMGRALQADPAFPLYRARRAWLEGTEGAEAARIAAEEGEAVAPLWLAAGVLAREAGLEWAGEALARACRLDPLGATAPFQLLLLDP
ncbi:MAG TPA: O-antigen ligase family protein, partial [Thermoanaerobaculia bacterium]|nr:O-antigen ligase family protein [Thermoanaerobaculia bacterium]